jgi:hypothetical protein
MRCTAYWRVPQCMPSMTDKKTNRVASPFSHWCSVTDLAAAVPTQKLTSEQLRTLHDIQLPAPDAQHVERMNSLTLPVTEEILRCPTQG